MDRVILSSHYTLQVFIFLVFGVRLIVFALDTLIVVFLLLVRKRIGLVE